MTTPVFEQPRIITLNQLIAAVAPHIQGYKWAMGTVMDLWKLCAPTPNQILSPNPSPRETRIINPGQFANWWADVQQRMGLDMTPDEAIPIGRSWA